MLERLETIDWASVRHAHGPASDIPLLLRTLLSPNKGARQRAIEELDTFVHHQGTLSEAAVYVAPFFIELLQTSETPDKANIAATLALLADEKSPEHCSRDELHWSQSIRTIVAQHLDLLYPYLQATEPTVRWIIADTLALFPAAKATSLPLLERALEGEAQPEVRKGIEAAIDKLHVSAAL
jgi:hypothetical protein